MNRHVLRSILFFLPALFPISAQALTVTSFSPGGGPGGTQVSIRGTGFVSATNVQFNGINASWFISSDSLIIATVPGPAATGPIRVYEGASFSSSPTNFFVGNPPNIFSFTPSGGNVGSVVTINGASFLGITSVRFNGLSASFTVNSTSQITATVPNGAATGSITVANPAGTATSSTFYFPPIITSVSPPGGVPGTPVTINGANFSLVYQADFNGVPVGFSTQSDSKIVTTVPGGATTGPLRLTSAAGNNSIGFFVGPAPSISSLSPQGGPAGTPVTVTGAGFDGITSVTFGGVAASFNVLNSTTLTATVPGGSATGLVAVSNPAGTANSTSPFFVGNPPVVNGFTPGAGPVGSTVTLNGAHFLGATSVRFGGGINAGSFVVNSDASITAVVPAFAVSGPIEVINPAGSGASLQAFNLSPRITTFSPPSVPAATATGTPVTVTGYNLSSVFDVSFNGVSTAFNPLDDQHLVAQVPAGATSGPITASSLFGNAVSPFAFEVVHFSVPPFVPGVAWPHWPDVNVPVAPAPTYQIAAAVAADSSGGSFIVWQESDGTWNLRLQHLDAYGQRAPGWPTDGIVIADTAGHQQNPRVVADQVGGVIVVWEDGRSGEWDLYALRITGAGQRAVGWTSQGVAVSKGYATQQAPRVCSDGASGIYVAWEDLRNSNWDIYAQHLLANGSVAAGWDPNGIPVCTQGSHQQRAAILRTLDGGIYVAWSDGRNGTTPFLQRLQSDGLVASGWPADGVNVSAFGSYSFNALIPTLSGDVLVAFMDSRPIVQRMTSSGQPHPAWPVNGRVLAPSAYTNSETFAVADAQGGAYLSWIQSANSWDVYATHVTAAGGIAAGWSASGTAVTSVNGEQYGAQMTSDAQGGAFVAWYDNRYGDDDVFVQRLMNNLPVAPGWPLNGTPVSQVAFSSQTAPVITADGRGGAVLAWSDGRNPSNSLEVYAQNLTGASKLGNPEPALLSVEDVPGDQGGKARIRWTPSYLDTLPLIEISNYGVWRQTTEVAANAAVRRGSRMLFNLDTEDDSRPGMFLRLANSTGYTYWEGLGSILARGQALYSFVVNTLADSSNAGPADAVYMVDAHASAGPYFWDTQPMAGHSVDNIAPATPTGLVSNYAGTTTSLRWSRGSEHDLNTYRVYRGTVPDFFPSDPALVTETPDTAFTDPAIGTYFYKVQAVDIHGNRSGLTLAVPPSLVGVGGSGITRPEFSAPHPNPASHDTRFELRLPTAGRVTIEIYDASGRLCRVLVDGVLPAGENVLLWDLQDTFGRGMPAGLYFARARGTGFDTRKRLVVVR